MKKQKESVGECRKKLPTLKHIVMSSIAVLLFLTAFFLYLTETQESDIMEYHNFNANTLYLFIGGFGERWNRSLTQAAYHLFPKQHYIIGYWNQFETLKQRIEERKYSNIIIFGHSWGAYAAIRLAFCFPEKKITVISLDPVGKIPDLQKYPVCFQWLNIKCCPVYPEWSDFIADCGKRWEPHMLPCKTFIVDCHHNAPFTMLHLSLNINKLLNVSKYSAVNSKKGVVL